MFEPSSHGAAPSTDVIVVGAGLSGLTTAFLLARAGLRVEVLEAGARPGGVIGSRRRDGVLIESGPNSALDTSPLIGALLRAAGIEDERLDADPVARRRYVLRDGRLLPLPLSPPAMLRTPLFSWRAKLRLLREPFVGRAPAETEETVAAFVRRRLGAELLDYAVEPFVAGVYAGDPEELAVQAAFPRLHALERDYGGLIRGLVLGARERRRSAEKAKNAAGSFSFRGGMQTLTDALVRGLGEAGRSSVRCAARVVAIERASEGGWVVAAERGAERFVRAARAVVLAVPAYEAAALVGSLAPGAASALSEIVYPPVATVVSAFRRDSVAHRLDGFGFLAPGAEHPPVLGTLFSSSTFSARAPDGIVALTTFLGGRRNPERAGDEPETIAEVVQAALHAHLGASAPLWSEVTRWPRAIPQYTLGHLRRLSALDSAERARPGLFFCANYRGGVSAGDCIKSAHAIADRVLLVVRGAAPPTTRGTASAQGAGDARGVHDGGPAASFGPARQ